MSAEAEIAAIWRGLTELRRALDDPAALERRARRLRDQRARAATNGLRLDRSEGRRRQR